MFKMMAQFQPPPPEGAGSPLDWGRPEYVEGLLGDAFDLKIEERESTFAQSTAEDYWTKFSPAFGPCKTPRLDEAEPGLSLIIDRVTNGRNVMPPFRRRL